MNGGRPPLPPRELMLRTGASHDADAARLNRYFNRSGLDRKRAILRLLPDGYSLTERRVLDFGCGSGRVLRHFLREADTGEFLGCDLHEPSIEWVKRNLSPPIDAYALDGRPRLPHPDDHFDLIYAISVFTHIADGWSEWLLEIHRTLKPDGLFIATFLGPATWAEVAPQPIDEDRLGIAFLEMHQELSDTSGPNVLHSRWWLREHWGRAFEILTIKPDGFVTPGAGHGVIVGRKRDASLTPEQLEAPGDDPREAGAARLARELLDEEPDQAHRRPARALAAGFRRLKGRRPARREVAPAGDTAALGGETSRPWLEPVLLDHAGRDGSTLLMRLLFTSPEIAVEGPYPYEQKYFAYLLRWTALLGREYRQADEWSPASLGSLTQADRSQMMGPPPWSERSLFASADGEPAIAEQVFALVWSEFSRRAIEASSERHRNPAVEARFYAEKHLQTWELDRAALPRFRAITLLRDPRDVYLSILAFNDKREGTSPIGRAPGEPVERWRERFIETQRRRLRWIAEVLADGEQDEAFVVRYEDLVGDLAAEAARIEAMLGVTLSPKVVLEDKRLRAEHATSASAEASVGRWRREMSAPDATEFASALGEELEAVGFDA